MPIYINKNNQQTGPYEDHVVIEQLRSGMLSPDDLGIHHGGTTWHRLGDMFPDAVPSSSMPTPEPPPIAVSAAASASVVDEPRKGGCRKALGWLILILGVLMMLGGAAGAIGTRLIPIPSCEIADKYDAEARQATKEADDAKGTPRQVEAEKKAIDKLESARIWMQGCNEARSYYNMAMIGAIVAAVIGFFMTIIGFFLRRTPAA